MISSKQGGDAYPYIKCPLKTYRQILSILNVEKNKNET